MTDFKKLGRNNKNRGRAFERRVAELLDVHRVDDLLSAGRAGLIEHHLDVLDGGDLVDGMGAGDWLLECKTQPAGNISVKDGWIWKVIERANLTDKHAGIVTTRYREQGGWVILPKHDDLMTAARFIGVHNLWPWPWWQTKARGDGDSFVIQDSWISDMGPESVAFVAVERQEPGEWLHYLFLDLDYFACLIKRTQL